ncbi:hypothetical protein VCHA43P277_110059 [Vibrio chagasii]|nr:hypothetical protein VCHA34P120_100195 [Vibrio chagasii]CAH6900591.1 hypothetical protein VCHA43P277_110059 [Vibrio chagasii]CAH6926699.1 hypothetical protein VCHA56P515_110126 [Vibrio chagasii]CAH6931924.1 hypothetical protein VCHA41O247_100178 [Vibrio chagasii]CAH6988216.1 hypothetical protein VCHA53O463_120125 [Vibrio chagasii]
MRSDTITNRKLFEYSPDFASCSASSSIRSIDDVEFFI